jgi:4a-hydroxytetrahydrobiopterin dehydratase
LVILDNLVFKKATGGFMVDLTGLHCIRVSADTPRLTDNEIMEALVGHSGWQTYKKNGEPRLEKSYKFRDFKQAMAFTNLVAQTANEEDHHPAILTEWAKVTVTWWTHRIHGLHQNDFIMAVKTDKLYGSQEL